MDAAAMTELERLAEAVLEDYEKAMVNAAMKGKDVPPAQVRAAQLAQAVRGVTASRGR